MQGMIKKLASALLSFFLSDLTFLFVWAQNTIFIILSIPTVS